MQCGELLLLEHYPVYTFGLRQKDFETQADNLRKLGAEVVKVICKQRNNFLLESSSHVSPYLKTAALIRSNHIMMSLIIRYCVFRFAEVD